MNADPTPTPDAEPPRPEPKPAERGLLRHPALWIAGLALLAALGNWWEARSRLDTMQGELARRLNEGANTARDSQALARHTQEQLAAVQAKLGVLESKLGETLSQHASLEALYQDLSRSRDDRLLVEIEDIVNQAVQHLQLGGNVPAALIALQSADARLARADSPQFLPVRRAINADIERLKALPALDAGGMALKLEGMIAAVDSLPFAYEAQPRSEPSAAAPAPGFWRALASDVWRELRQLVRVERMDRPDPGLLAPQHGLFLRENLKLRLVNARLSLLQRDTRSFREDLRQAQGTLERYFDPQSRSTQNMIVTMRQLAGPELQLELPNLNESLSALSKLQAARDRAALPPPERVRGGR